MKTLFIVTSFWAYGELEIAMQFASGLDKKEVLFWAPRKQESSIRSKGFDVVSFYINLPSLNKAILKNIEQSYKPDFIILADYLNYIFCEKHYGLTLDDLDYFSGCIGAFDLYNLSSKPRSMDTYKFKNKLIKVDREKVKFLLMPCPLLDSSVNNYQDKVFATNLVNELKIRSKDEQVRTKINLGIDSSKKLILITSAEWQMTYKKYKSAIKFVEQANSVFIRIINELSKNYQVICIGSKSLEFNQNVKKLDSLSPIEFDKYIKAADLFITRNIISTSFAKIILKGVKGIVLINSDEEQYPYKCKMFPVGWYSFLEEIESNNTYFELFKQVEMFDEQHCLEVITNTLNEEENNERLINYHERLNKIMKPHEILKFLNEN